MSRLTDVKFLFFSKSLLTTNKEVETWLVDPVGPSAFTVAASTAVVSAGQDIRGNFAMNVSAILQQSDFHSTRILHENSPSLFFRSFFFFFFIYSDLQRALPQSRPMHRARPVRLHLRLYRAPLRDGLQNRALLYENQEQTVLSESPRGCLYSTAMLRYRGKGMGSPLRTMSIPARL